MKGADYEKQTIGSRVSVDGADRQRVAGRYRCVCIAIGERMPNPFAQPAMAQVGFLALAMIVIGILVGWRWELAGGILSLAGWCLFLEPVKNSQRGLTWFIWTLALPGVLYVISALLRRHNKRQT
jgi:hypothetical protein